MNIKQLSPYLWILLTGIVLFFPFLGNVPLFDWDEANFAEAAREMVVTGNYMRVQVDFMPFWEKPPLFIWMQALSMKLLGINAYAARFPNAVIGIVTLCSLYYTGNKVSHRRLGKWWVALYVASWLPHFYFKTAIIDPAFNLFIFYAVYQLYIVQVRSSRSYLHALLSGVFLGLAVLTKGPVAILIALLTLVVFVVLQRFKVALSWKHILVLSLACFVTTFTWFGIDIVQNGWWFTKEFITYQIRLFSTEDAGHGGPFFYHWLVLLFGCFPASAFLFQYFKKPRTAYGILANEKLFSSLMWALFGVVLILFSVVKTKIVHYSSLCYFPLTYLAAVQVQALYEGTKKLTGLTKFLFLISGGLMCLAIVLLPVIGKNLQALIPYVNDVFAIGNMQARVRWHYYEMIFGLLALAAMIAALFIMRKHISKGFGLLTVSQCCIIFITMAVFVPRIEQYSQHAAIEFYTRQKDNAYVHPLGFKSYAYLFYSGKEAIQDSAYYKDRTDYLLNAEDIDKPVYFISKNTFEKEALEYKNIEKIGEKNGYVFYRRINN